MVEDHGMESYTKKPGYIGTGWRCASCGSLTMEQRRIRPVFCAVCRCMRFSDVIDVYRQTSVVRHVARQKGGKDDDR
jgi:hypothetical protein